MLIETVVKTQIWRKIILLLPNVSVCNVKHSVRIKHEKMHSSEPLPMHSKGRAVKDITESLKLNFQNWYVGNGTINHRCMQLITFTDKIVHCLWLRVRILRLIRSFEHNMRSESHRIASFLIPLLPCPHLPPPPPPINPKPTFIINCSEVGGYTRTG